MGWSTQRLVRVVLRNQTLKEAPMKKKWFGVVWDSLVIVGLFLRQTCLRLCGRTP
jgi:hypothetical protein